MCNVGDGSDGDRNVTLGKWGFTQTKNLGDPMEGVVKASDQNDGQRSLFLRESIEEVPLSESDV